jgi:hypothetical protein
MEKEDTISVQWAQEDVETSYSLLNNNNSNNNNNVDGDRSRTCVTMRLCKCRPGASVLTQAAELW